MCWKVHAQVYKAKLGLFIFPLPPSGYGTCNLGLERLDPGNANSWQLHAHLSFGTLGADAPEVRRKWITIERTHYVKPAEKKTLFFYTGFLELGSRKTLPGFVDFPPDAVLQNEKAFECSPGIGIGVSFRFLKRFGLDLVAGPKLIFATHKDSYYNSITRQGYTKRYQDVNAGYRGMGALSIRFGKM